LASVRDMATLEARVFEAIRDLTKAEQATLILTEELEGPVVYEGVWRRTGDQSWTVSRTIVARVLHEGLAILAGDVPSELPSSESLVLTSIRSLVAVPIGKVGVLYLDSRSPVNRFDNQDLELAAAIGNIVALALNNMRDLELLADENERLREDLGITHDIQGDSDAIRGVLQYIRKAAAADSNVLVLGESGTGKELVARALHDYGKRRSGPFVAINMAAIPRELIEAELFGHERGAFTGALNRGIGRFEQAAGGTLFLDEIGDMPPEAQTRLLRVLQEGEYEPLGGNTVKADVRIVAATNRDLLAEVQAGRFREDLYYRLNVIAVTAPPLRARREDIPLLVDHFVGLYSKKNGKARLSVARAALERMLDYAWPGNVRELENVIERAVVLSRGDTLTEHDLPEAIAKSSNTAPRSLDFPVGTPLAEIELRVIKETLKHTKGDKSLAAQLLGISTRTIYRKLDGVEGVEGAEGGAGP
ncbi:MAG: sigma-54-dependent Fis family transcriptional regulator, partial [Deltaproteobacteria bacterium]|nr:sigma-54-dependent Fis family transcriptional regulator [Deltaproteobacteria bacterium]